MFQNCVLSDLFIVSVSFLEALLIRSHRQLNLSVEYLQPLMSKTKAPVDEDAENETEEQ